MTKFRFRSRMPRSTWFDRLSLYRYGTILILLLCIRGWVRIFMESIPFTPWLVIFWFATALLVWACGRDWWQVLQARREIHRAIDEVVKNDDSVS